MEIRTQKIWWCSKVLYYAFGPSQCHDRVSTVDLCRTGKTYTLITCALSIVFVHGFGGHRKDTWTSDGVYWPKDFLKPKLERVHVIAFGYNADISRFTPRRRWWLCLSLRVGTFDQPYQPAHRVPGKAWIFFSWYMTYSPRRTARPSAYFRGPLYWLYCCQKR